MEQWRWLSLGSVENGSFSKAKGGKEGGKWWRGLISWSSRWKKGNKQKLFAFPQWESLSGQAGRRGQEGQAGRLADGQPCRGEWVARAREAGGLCQAQDRVPCLLRKSVVCVPFLH